LHGQISKEIIKQAYQSNQQLFSRILINVTSFFENNVTFSNSQKWLKKRQQKAVPEPKTLLTV